MRTRIVCLALLVLLTTAAYAATPAAAIEQAKKEMESGNHGLALRLLRGATAEAAAMRDLGQRGAALATIHFYAALAASNLGNKQEATDELRSYLLYGGRGTLDPKRFPREFTTLFAEVQKKMDQGRSAPASFDDAYPGYPPTESSSVWPPDVWGASSEFLILGTPHEREQWNALKDNEARRQFIAAFWEARDPDPATKVNEARIELLHRIAFADVAFIEGADARGSLTDRGRVFVLLGPPSRVSIRPLTRREAPATPHRTIDVGNAMEQWTYFREQLPKKLPHNEVVFNFISDGGSIVRKLQHDFMADKAFKDAPLALRRD
jgi:GWxTD domain-containing protein